MPSSTTLNPEWPLLLAACSAIPGPGGETSDLVISLLREPIRWNALIDLADQHGVSSLLYRNLSGYKISADEIPSLKQRYQTNIHKTLLVAREMIRVLDRLSALGIAAMPYKGVALAESMYGDMALRQSGDIDLFIRAQDFVGIKSAVAELGYAPHMPLSPTEERAYLISGYECAFDSDAGRNLLEVQWALQPRFYAVDLTVESLFRRAVSVTVAGREMKMPSPEDLLLILSVHAAKHVWERLIWLCDIAQIIKLPNLNWPWIADQARILGVARILHVTLLLANRLLEATIPASVESATRGDHTAFTLADEIYAQITEDAKCDVESTRYFRLMLRLRERRLDRMKFLQRLVFTPGPSEWKAIRLPAPMFPLYRLVRLSRLAARLARA